MKLTQSRDDSAEKEIMGWKLPEVLTREELDKIAAAGLLTKLSELVLGGLSNPIPNFANEAVSDVIKALKGIMEWKLPEVLTPEEFNKIAAVLLLTELSELVSGGLSNPIRNSANEAVSNIIEKSLWHAYDAAEFTQSGDNSVEKFKQVVAVLFSGISSASRLQGIIVGLPVTIWLIFREIQLVSKNYNRDLASSEVKQECLSVFLLGTSWEGDNTADSEFTVQCLINKIVPQLMEVLALKLISLVSPPVIDIAIDVVSNLVYIKHYHELAHVKFQLTDLSPHYDAKKVQAEFKKQVKARRIRMSTARDVRKSPSVRACVRKEGATSSGCV